MFKRRLHPQQPPDKTIPISKKAANYVKNLLYTQLHEDFGYAIGLDSTGNITLTQTEAATSNLALDTICQMHEAANYVDRILSVFNVASWAGIFLVSKTYPTPDKPFGVVDAFDWHRHQHLTIPATAKGLDDFCKLVIDYVFMQTLTVVMKDRIEAEAKITLFFADETFTYAPKNSVNPVASSFTYTKNDIDAFLDEIDLMISKTSTSTSCTRQSRPA